MNNKNNKFPWINFNIDTRLADIKTWLLLGEAQSKCKHIAGTLLDPEVAQKMHTLYLAKGALATTAIEGNTLTEDQVIQHLEGKLELPKSKEYLQKEVDNILDACNSIADEHFTACSPLLCVDEITKYNGLVLKNLDLEEGIVPGEIRNMNVTVGRYRAPDVPLLNDMLHKLCAMLNDKNFSFGEEWLMASGIFKAIVAHLYIAWIHPFGDGNGRTARLVEFKICISAGVPAPAAHLLSNHYNETRNAYYKALDETSKENNPFIFINYALEGYIDQLGEQIKWIRNFQYKVFWTNYIYSRFKERNRAIDKRRRDLILELSGDAFPDNEWTEIALLEDRFPRIARIYAGTTSMTLRRDIQELVNTRLLEKEKNKIRPNISILSVYLPRQINQQD